MKKLFEIVIALLCLQANFSTFAQTTVLATNESLSKEEVLQNNFKQYELYEIDTENLISKITSEDYDGKVIIEFQEGLKWDLSLFANSTIASEYVVKVATESGDQIVHPTNNITYVGYLNNQSDSEVRLTITNGFIYGYVRDQSSTFYIEPARHFESLAKKDVHVIYNSLDVHENPNITCAHEEADEFTERLKTENGSAENDQNCITLKLAIASDYAMYTKYNSNVNELIARNIGVLNNVQANFINEFEKDIEFEIVTQFISSCSTCDPWSDTTIPGALLYEVRDWGEGGGFGTQDYAMAQFWTNRDFDGSVVGYAFVNGLCEYKRYHLLQDFVDDAEQIRVMTTHEMGHNMGSGHDTYGEFAIMAPNLTSFTNWSDDSKGIINSAINAKLADHPTCLPICAPTDVPTVNFDTGGTTQLCVGQSIQFKDRSLGAADSWNWSFQGGYPSSSNSQNVSVTYPNPGVYTVTLVSGNDHGQGAPLTKTSYIRVYDIAPVAATCVPDADPGIGGIKKVVLNTINHASSLAGAEETIYVDNSCGYTTELIPNKEYPIYLYLGYCFGTQSYAEYFKVFIDYNNDGDFDDADEMVANSGNEAYCGVAPMQLFTTPSNPVFDNFLRVRVVTDVVAFNDACHVPTQGQVEDYGVLFKSPEVFSYQANGCQSETVSDVSGSEWINIYSNFDLVASINPNGNDLGDLTVEFDILQDVPQLNGSSYLPRNFNFECNGPDCLSGFFPTAVTVKLYYLESEINQYNYSSGLNIDFNNLNIAHYSGGNEDCNPLNNNSGTTELIFASQIQDYTYTAENTNAHVLEFDLNHFSEASATGVSAALSTQFESLKAQWDEDIVVLDWIADITDEEGTFLIERSSDSEHFEFIGAVDQSFNQSAYQFEDNAPISGKSYYRITFENAHKEVHSSIVMIRTELADEMAIAPNPVNGDLLRLLIDADKEGVRNIQVFDSSAKLMHRSSENVAKGRSEVLIDVHSLSRGIYFLKVQSQKGLKTIKFTKI